MDVNNVILIIKINNSVSHVMLGLMLRIINVFRMTVVVLKDVKSVILLNRETNNV